MTDETPSERFDNVISNIGLDDQSEIQDNKSNNSGENETAPSKKEVNTETEPVEIHELTGFQRDLLYCIAGLSEPHGTVIKENLTEYMSEEVNHGRLYPNLDKLVKKGLVKKSAKNDRTNMYIRLY